MPGRPTAVSHGQNLRAGLWLLADMSLNIWAISIVKAIGGDYPAWQIVFLRATFGLMLILPWLLREHHALGTVRRPGLQALRVLLSTVTLSASFFAVTQVPLALFMTLNFTRPLLTMALSALILREVVTRRRWLVGGAGLIGVVIAANPDNVAWTWGLLAVGVVVTTGTGAIIVTRMLKGTPPVMMMLFYTAGLAVFTAPPALISWTPIPHDHWPLLVAVGVFSQCAQFCFLKAHWLGEAGFLSPLGYLSLVLSSAVGYAVFGEIPTLDTVIGAVLIVGATLTLIGPQRGKARPADPE